MMHNNLNSTKRPKVKRDLNDASHTLKVYREAFICVYAY